MYKVYVLVEGQTEERFVKDVLSEYLLKNGTYIIPITVKNKIYYDGTAQKGGHTPYHKIKKELLNLLNDPSAAKVTTMFDYYALYSDFPGKQRMIKGKFYEKVKFLEEEFRKDIAHQKFLPYFQVHEFEALLFSSKNGFAAFTNNPVQLCEIDKIIDLYENPEEINDSSETAPSKRIEKIFPRYRKPLDGVGIAKNIGIEKMLEKCIHFRDWIEELTNFEVNKKGL